MKLQLKKIITCSTLALTILLGGSSLSPYSKSVYAESTAKSIKIVISDVEVETDVVPTIIYNRTMVPTRVVGEELGFDVNWDEPTKTAVLEKDNVVYRVTVGSDVVTSSKGDIIELDSPAIIAEGRTLLPLRAIAEMTGAKVDWDNSTRTVYINSSFEPGPQPQPKLKPRPKRKPTPDPNPQKYIEIIPVDRTDDTNFKRNGNPIVYGAEFDSRESFNGSTSESFIAVKYLPGGTRLEKMLISNSKSIMLSGYDAAGVSFLAERGNDDSLKFYYKLPTMTSEDKNILRSYGDTMLDAYDY